MEGLALSPLMSTSYSSPLPTRFQGDTLFQFQRQFHSVRGRISRAPKLHVAGSSHPGQQHTHRPCHHLRRFRPQHGSALLCSRWKAALPSCHLLHGHPRHLGLLPGTPAMPPQAPAAALDGSEPVALTFTVTRRPRSRTVSGDGWMRVTVRTQTPHFVFLANYFSLFATSTGYN